MPNPLRLLLGSPAEHLERRAKTQHRRLLYLAHLMFDDDCDIDDLRGGCEAAGRLALLHLLRLFGVKLIAAAERIGYDPKVLSRLNPPRTMNNVAACGCPDTLRALLAIIGLADEQCDGLGETLLGGPDVPWTPGPSATPVDGLRCTPPRSRPRLLKTWTSPPP